MLSDFESFFFLMTKLNRFNQTLACKRKEMEGGSEEEEKGRRGGGVRGRSECCSA